MQLMLSIAANTLTLLLVVFIARDAWRYLAGKIAVPLFLCSIGYSLILLHVSYPLPIWAFQTAVLLNIFNLGLGWLFAQALLSDGFKLDIRAWIVFSLTVVTIAAADADVFGFSPPGHKSIEQFSVLVALAVMVHMLWIATSGFKGDLLNIRRTVRAWFIIFVVLSFGLLIGLEAFGASAMTLGITYDLTTTLIVGTILMWAAKFNSEKLFTQLPAQLKRTPSPRKMDPKFHQRLIEIMEIEKAFQQPDLSVAALSDRMGIPDHKLRELINAELGFRNFSAFVNGYRIEQAVKELADTENSEKPILAIAMDSGFQTLSTFNRAFKAIKDETPSEFRARALNAVQVDR